MQSGSDLNIANFQENIRTWRWWDHFKVPHDITGECLNPGSEVIILHIYHKHGRLEVSAVLEKQLLTHLPLHKPVVDLAPFPTIKLEFTSSHLVVAQSRDF